MKKKQVGYKEYRGALTPKQAAEGINAATRNAARLLADAEILYNAGRYATAAALAMLSIEESGKPKIVTRLVGIDDEKEIKQEWTNYRDHRSKERWMDCSIYG